MKMRLCMLGKFLKTDLILLSLLQSNS
ncbi:hypothetical protein LM700876_270182 [Listeria monocytogenes]|nr:hypothetical protein LM600918_270179 [Listeria monocytogenes]CUL00077.1 hypothetical protein LM700876_270182 [Listeria monocytogenes]